MSPSDQAIAFWDAVRAAPQQVSLPIAQRREAGEHAEDATAEPEGVTAGPWAGGDGIHVRPDGVAPVGRILYLFGGGYMLGSPASRRKTAGHLALAAQAEVVVAAYRRAPEHPYPAGIDDAVAAYTALRAEGPVVIAGDSSGGGLAVATALRVGDAAGVIAFSPWADLTCSGATMGANAARDIECTRESLLEMAGWYAAGHDPADPLLSPVFADPAALPPMIVFVGDEEVLLDDARRLTEGADDRILEVGEGMQHVYPIWTGVFPEAGEAIATAGAWAHDVLAAASA